MDARAQPSGDCKVCGASGFACGRCRSVFYCSKDHQKQDWPEHRGNCPHREQVNVPPPTPYQEALRSRMLPGVRADYEKVFEEAYRGAPKPGELTAADVLPRHASEGAGSRDFLNSIPASMISAITNSLRSSEVAFNRMLNERGGRGGRR